VQKLRINYIDRYIRFDEFQKFRYASAKTPLTAEKVTTPMLRKTSRELLVTTTTGAEVEVEDIVTDGRGSVLLVTRECRSCRPDKTAEGGNFSFSDT
jgi:hypothetical protein